MSEKIQVTNEPEVKAPAFVVELEQLTEKIEACGGGDGGGDGGDHADAGRCPPSDNPVA